MNRYRLYFKHVFQRLKYNYQYEYLTHLRFLRESTIDKVYQEKIIYPKEIINNSVQPFSSQDTKVENPFIDVEKSSIFYMLNAKDKNFYDLLCPVISSNSNSEDPLLAELQSSLTVKDVFDALENYHEPFSISHACQTIFSLSQIKNSRQFKYKNSLIHFHLDEDFYSVINSHPQFSKVMTFLEENVDRLTDKTAPLMMSLNNLNIELSHELMIKLHISLLKNIPNLDKYSLVQFSYVFINKGMKGYFTQIKILSEINKLYSKHLTSLEDLFLFSLIYHNMYKIISSENADKYANVVHSFIKEKKIYDSNSTGLILILKTLSNLYHYNIPIHINKFISELLAERIQQLTPQQLALLNFLFLFIMEPKNLLNKMQENASRYINECSSISLKTDLLLCLSINSSYKEREMYESIATEIINESHTGENLGALYKTVKHLKTTDYQLRHSFWVKILENVKARLLQIDKSIGVRERVLYDLYYKYMFFNDDFKKFRNNSLENEVISLMKAELETCTQYIPRKAAHMIAFLIAYSDDTLFDEWYEILQRNTNQLKEIDIMFLSKAVQIQMNNNKRNKNRMAFLSKLRNYLDCCTENLLKDQKVSSLQNNISLMSSYLQRNGSGSNTLFQSLNQEHVKHLNQLNSNFINQMSRNFKLAFYTNPQVFDAMTDYIIVNEGSVLFNTVHKVLQCFYALGFIPAKASEFAEACQKVIESDCERMPCHLLLESCIYLSLYKSLSSELIHYIFSEKFLDQLEEEIAFGIKRRNYSDYVRALLMKLNRIVCLDNPEEKIPWFHENYCKDQCEMKSFGISLFHKDIFKILALILGDENLICFNKKSPYYYNIDLEFALNEEGLPVSPNEQIKLKQNEKNLFVKNKTSVQPYKRVAVFARQSNCYSTNSDSQIGACQLQRKHLEMLGYIVVEVPEHLWYSMSIANKEDKFRLLKSLIYKELLKIS